MAFIFSVGINIAGLGLATDAQCHAIIRVCIALYMAAKIVLYAALSIRNNWRFELRQTGRYSSSNAFALCAHHSLSVNATRYGLEALSRLFAVTLVSRPSNTSNQNLNSHASMVSAVSASSQTRQLG